MSRNPDSKASCWSTRPLGEIAQVRLGKMLDKSKHRRGAALPYIRNVDVRWGSIETDDLHEMNFEEAELDRFGLRAGEGSSAKAANLVALLFGTGRCRT